MKTGVEGYAEVQAMAQLDVLAVMDELINLAHQCITFVPPEGPTCEEHNAEYEETACRWLIAKEAKSKVIDLIEAIKAGIHVERIFVELTSTGEIDCRASWAIELCDAIQSFQDARVKYTGRTVDFP